MTKQLMAIPLVCDHALRRSSRLQWADQLQLRRKQIETAKSVCYFLDITLYSNEKTCYVDEDSCNIKGSH